MTPHAQRLLRSVQQAGRRRTLRWHRHQSLLTCTRCVDAANELTKLGRIAAVDSEGRRVDRVRENAESVLVELKK